MNVTLGSAFTPIPEIEPPEEDLLALRLELVLTALDNLAGSLRDMPTPQISIDAPDLSAIVTAVNGLKPGVDADQIAAAVVHAISPQPAQTVDEGWKDELLTALKKLDFRMKGQSGTAITPPAGMTVLNTNLNPVPVTGTISVTPSDTRSLTERMSARAPFLGYHLWLDVLSSDPTRIIVAEAPDGTTQATAAFRGTRVTLDANGNPVGAVETATAFAWSSRGTATWVS